MIDGILVIDKPDGPTSNDICQRIKRLLRCRRVGHTGTLDPLATGVLPLLLNGATKWATRYADDEKEYGVVARFGRATTTYDREGTTVTEAAVPRDLRERVAALLPRFLGAVAQAPPPFSAVKYRGRPLYWWARRGQFPNVSPRLVDVTVFELSIDGVERLPTTGDQRPATHYSFHITCSKGTYIRSLIHDLGRAVGCGAHVVALRRLRSGPFGIGTAVPWHYFSTPDFAIEAVTPCVIREPL